MKKSLVIFCLIGALSVECNASNTTTVNLGMVSQLVEIKYLSEAFLMNAMANQAAAQPPNDSALIFYNDVRIQLDRIISQMTADMVERNSLKIYQKLNVYYTQHRFSETDGADRTILSYVLAFKDLDNSFQTNINPEKTVLKADLLSAATILSVVNTGWTILKGVREQRGKKVDGIIELLDKLRLNSPAEISKGKNK